MTDDKGISCICTTPINIAIVKYWGKKNEELNTPINTSFSVTLDTEKLFTRTKISLLNDDGKEEDSLMIDGVKKNILENPKVKKVLNEVKRSDFNCAVKIVSNNSFPACVGLASSSSAFSALALGLGKILNLDFHRVCVLSRIGSGSSCRSLFGGFVEWSSGEQLDGSDSVPRQVYSHDKWPELRIIVLQVSDTPKGVPSGIGMQMSVKSSQLLNLKTINKLSEKRIEILKKAINDKNFNEFGEIVMKESNTFHSICMDTFPPIEPPYLSKTSHDIIRFVHELNLICGETVCAYTFDAGPNAFLFTLEKNVEKCLSGFFTVFPNMPIDDPNYIEKIFAHYKVIVPNETFMHLKKVIKNNDHIQSLYLCKVGDGPHLI